MPAPPVHSVRMTGDRRDTCLTNHSRVPEYAGVEATHARAVAGLVGLHISAQPYPLYRSGIVRGKVKVDPGLSANNWFGVRQESRDSSKQPWLYTKGAANQNVAV